MASKQSNFYSLFFFLTIALAAIFRLSNFNAWSLHNDELSTIYRAKYDSLSEVISIGVKSDVHPALNEVFIYSWMNIFGDSPFWVRLPYVLLSIIGLYFAYLFVKEIGNRISAVLSLIVLSTTQLFVIYSQVARPYAIGFCLLMIFSYCWSKLIKENNWKWSILLAILISLCAMTHYFLALSILLIYLAGFAYIKWNKNALIKYLSSGILGLLLFSPHIPLTIHQLSRKGLGWLPAPESDFLLQFLHYSLNDSWILISLILMAPIIAILSANFCFPKAKTLLLPLVFLISFAVGYYYSLKVNPVIQFSALIFSFPFLIIFFFLFFSSEKVNRAIKAYVITLLVVSTSTLILKSDVYGAKRFGNFEGVANQLIEWKKEKGDELMVLSSSSSPLYLDYYYHYLDFPIEEEIDDFSKVASIAQARDKIQNSNSKYLALGFANAPLPAEVYEFARLYYPRIIGHKQYFNSDALLLSKLEESDTYERKYSFKTTVSDSLIPANWEVAPHLIEDSIFHSPSISFKIKENDLYLLTYRNTVAQIFSSEEDWLSISTFLKSSDSSNLKLVVSIDRDGENIDWRGIDSKSFYKKNQWYQMMFVYPLAAKAEQTDLVTIYFWNPDKSDVFIDDFELLNYEDANFNYYHLQ